MKKCKYYTKVNCNGIRYICNGFDTNCPSYRQDLEELDAMQIAKNQDIHKGEDYNSEDYRIYNRGSK